MNNFFPLWRLLNQQSLKSTLNIASVVVQNSDWATVYVFSVIEPFNTLVINMALAPHCNIIPVIASLYQYYCKNLTEPVMVGPTFCERTKQNNTIKYDNKLTLLPPSSKHSCGPYEFSVGGMRSSLSCSGVEHVSYLAIWLFLL